MTTYTHIGAYDAKTHFPEYLRKAQAGQSFRITNRGEHVADLVPPETTEKHRGAQAAERMKQFVKVKPSPSFDLKALLEEGRD